MPIPLQTQLCVGFRLKFTQLQFTLFKTYIIVVCLQFLVISVTNFSIPGLTEEDEGVSLGEDLLSISEIKLKMHFQ